MLYLVTTPGDEACDEQREHLRSRGVVFIELDGEDLRVDKAGRSVPAHHVKAIIDALTWQNMRLPAVIEVTENGEAHLA